MTRHGKRNTLVGLSALVLILTLPACQQARVFTPTTEPTYSFVKTDNQQVAARLSASAYTSQSLLAIAAKDD